MSGDIFHDFSLQKLKKNKFNIKNKAFLIIYCNFYDFTLQITKIIINHKSKSCDTNVKAKCNDNNFYYYSL